MINLGTAFDGQSKHCSLWNVASWCSCATVPNILSMIFYLECSR